MQTSGKQQKMIKPAILIIESDKEKLHQINEAFKSVDVSIVTSSALHEKHLTTRTQPKIIIHRNAFSEAEHLLLKRNKAAVSQTYFVNGVTNFELSECAKTIVVDFSPENIKATVSLLLDRFRQVEDEQKLTVVQTKLDETIKEFDAFGYIISHDLRGPLRALNGYSQILIEDQSDNLGESAVRMLGRIQSNVVKLESQLDDLLEFSRINRSEISLQKLDLEKIVKQALKSTKTKHELEITDLAPIYADKQLVQQLIKQLISNAVKFAKTDEILRINVGRDQDGFFIRDNGIGFEMQYASKLFNVFSRLNASGEYEGNGIGLAIARGIVEKHRGSIRIESEVGVGTTVFVKFPEKD